MERVGVDIATPQSAVFGHCLGEGFVPGSQPLFDPVEQLTVPGLPDPAATPHFVVHPVFQVPA